MSDSYVKGLVPRIRRILESSDLSTISAKGVRKQLVAQGEDEGTIKAARSKIDEEISTIYDRLTGAASPDPRSAPASASDRQVQPKVEPGSSQPQSMAPARVKQESKPSIHASSTSQPSTSAQASATMTSGRRVDETDEEMARRLQSEFDGAANGTRPRRANAAPAKKKKTKKRVSRASVGSDEEGGERKKKRAAPDNNFNKELLLSDALGQLVGAPRLSRPQVVKHIWEYVKSRGLQDQSDKRYILCDDTMKAVFHTDRLHMFTMNKLLVPHLRNPDEVIMKDEIKGGEATVPTVVAQAVGTAMEDQALDQVVHEVVDEDSDGGESAEDSADGHY
ncbi:hypothetical protein IAU60_005727 [Kwoniella sp. DSM 27419]